MDSPISTIANDNFVFQIIVISVIVLAILAGIAIYFFVKGEYFLTDIEKTLKRGEFESVIQKAQKYIKSKGAHYLAYSYLAQAYEHLKQPQPAVENYEKALISLTDAGNIAVKNNIMIKLGELYCTLSRWENAIGYFRFVLQNQPNHPGALKNLSNIYFQLHKYNSAMENLQKYLALKPNDAKATLMLAKTYNYMNQFQKSIDMLSTYYQFEQAISPDENTQNMTLLADNYIGLGKYKEAAATLKPLLSDRKINHKTLLKYITCLIRMNDLQKVHEATEEYVFRLPPHERCPVLYELANVYYSVGDYYRALDLWKSINAINPKYLDVKEVLKRFEILTQNPQLSKVYHPDDHPIVQYFLQKLKLYSEDKILDRNRDFIIFKENSFCSVLYRVPAPVNKLIINEIEDSLKRAGYPSIAVDLYSLFGVDDSGKKQLFYQKVKEINGSEFLAYVSDPNPMPILDPA